MRGFPQHINTRRDVENLLPLYPEQTKKFLQNCVDNRLTWQTTKELAAAKDGKTSATERIAEVEDDQGVKQLVQQQLVEDPQCRLFRLGLSVAEANQLIAPQKPKGENDHADIPK